MSSRRTCLTAACFLSATARREHASRSGRQESGHHHCSNFEARSSADAECRSVPRGSVARGLRRNDVAHYVVALRRCPFLLLLCALPILFLFVFEPSRRRLAALIPVTAAAGPKYNEIEWLIQGRLQDLLTCLRSEWHGAGTSSYNGTRPSSVFSRCTGCRSQARSSPCLLKSIASWLRAASAFSVDNCLCTEAAGTSSCFVISMTRLISDMIMYARLHGRCAEIATAFAGESCLWLHLCSPSLHRSVLEDVEWLLSPAAA